MTVIVAMETPDRWADNQRALFMRVYKFMLANQRAMLHPKTASMPEAEWEIYCHNAAWLAAETLIWADNQRALFMRVYKFMLANQRVMLHPKTALMPEAEWEIYCHNAAWLAAETLISEDITIFDSRTRQVIAATPRNAS